mgnify:FL=1
MVRPGLRCSEIDWENVKIHISKEEMEREQEHEAAIQQAKGYLIKNFPKFCTVSNVYYETEMFNQDAGMYEVMHVDHIVIGDQAIYVIKTVKFPEHVELYGSSDAKTWHYTENDDKRIHRVDNADKRNQRYREYMQMLAGEAVGREVPTIAIVNIIGLTDEDLHLNLESGHEVVVMDNLADRIRYYESTIDSNHVAYEYSDDLIRKFKEEEVYDNIIPQIRDVELKHRVYLKLSEQV